MAVSSRARTGSTPSPRSCQRIPSHISRTGRSQDEDSCLMPALLTAKPTLQEFMNRVSDRYDISREQLEEEIEGPRGKTPIAYLYRNHNGDRLISPLQDIDPVLALEPRVLASMCDDLGIPYEEFDLDPEKLEDFNFGTYLPEESSPSD